MVNFDDYKKVIKEFEDAYNEYDIIKFALLHKVIKNILRYKFYSEKSLIFDREEYKNKYERSVIEAHNFYTKKEDANFFKISSLFIGDSNNCKNILDIQGRYAHNDQTKNVTKVEIDEIIYIKNNFENLTKLLYADNSFKLNITPSEHILNDLNKIVYESTSSEMLSGIYNFATPKIQRLISWDSERTKDFLDSILTGNVMMDLKVYQIDNEINIFDGQHRTLVFIFLWYFLTGKINKYKLHGKYVKYQNGSFKKRMKGMETIFETVKNWYLENNLENNLNSIEKIKWKISIFDEKDFAKAFLLYNSNSYLVEKVKGTDILISTVIEKYLLNETQINECYKIFSEYSFISNSQRERYGKYDFERYANEIFSKTNDYKVFVATALTSFLVNDDIHTYKGEYEKIENIFIEIYKWCGLKKESLKIMMKYLNWISFVPRYFIELKNVSDIIERLKTEQFDPIKEYLNLEVELANEKKSNYLHSLESEDFNPFVFKSDLSNENNNPFYWTIQIPWLNYHAFNFFGKWYTTDGKIFKAGNFNIIIPNGIEVIKSNKAIIVSRSQSKDRFFKNVDEIVSHIKDNDIFYMCKKYYDEIYEGMNILDLVNVLKRYYDELKNEVIKYGEIK